MSSSCFAKAFVAITKGTYIVFFNEKEVDLFDNPDKKSLDKIQMKTYLIEVLAKYYCTEGYPWTSMAGPSIHATIHRILFSFQNEKVVYIIEKPNTLTRLPFLQNVPSTFL